jgi:DNA-binding response OmpR family regulator
VPILKNKNALIVSPYPLVLRNLSEQLTQYGLNVTALSDKYSAIGHIVGKQNNEKSYDLFIIEHNPPDIDAESLTKIIRDNSSKNLSHIIIMTTEEHAIDVEYNKSMYDAIFIKPIMPMILKKKLEEFIEIQLYGVNAHKQDESDTDSDSDDIAHCKTKRHENDICRFLAIMDEDLSSMLLQLVLTKANFKVDIVTTAAELYELLEEHTYDFILTSNKCNWIIPENLSNDIRRHHTDNKDSVIIMIYDTLKENIIKKLGRAGYDDFVQLPLSRSGFMDMIDSWNDPTERRMNANTKPKTTRKTKTTDEPKPEDETNMEATLSDDTLDEDNPNDLNNNDDDFKQAQ